MKKLFLLITMLCLFTSCSLTEHYKTPFETDGEVYKVALLPWKASTMDFEMKYRWTMTQALKDACKESGAFKFEWSVYPVNGNDVILLEDIDKTGLWERKKYGRYEPSIKKVLKIQKVLELIWLFCTTFR